MGCVLDMMCMAIIIINSQTGILQKTYTRQWWLKCQEKGAGHLWVISFTKELLTGNSGWIESFFLEDVTTGEFPMLQWVASCLHTYWQALIELSRGWKLKETLSWEGDMLEKALGVPKRGKRSCYSQHWAYLNMFARVLTVTPKDADR